MDLVGKYLSFYIKDFWPYAPLIYTTQNRMTAIGGADIVNELIR